MFVQFLLLIYGCAVSVDCIFGCVDSAWLALIPVAGCRWRQKCGLARLDE
jgi:hypothetical protein